MRVWISHHSAVAAMVLLAPLAACAPSSTTAPAPVTVGVHLAAATADSLHLVWQFKLQDQWYLYGPYRNDTGFAPSVTLSMPEGWTAGALRFPPPARKVLPGDILDHVYHGELLLAQTVFITQASIDDPSIEARVDWLACKDLCVPGQATLTVSVRDRHAVEGAALWARVQASLPQPLAPGTVQAARTPHAVTLTVPGAARLVFVPAEDAPLFADLLADGEAHGEVLTLRLRPAATEAPLDGLLSINYKNGDTVVGTFTLP